MNKTKKQNFNKIILPKISLYERQLNELFQKYPIELVYVFGSEVTGGPFEPEDVDVAILLSNNLSKTKRFDLRLDLTTKLSRIFKKEADVSILNDIQSLFFKYVIVKEGQIIYEKYLDQRADFESRILSLYFDFQPFLNIYNQNYVKNNI